MPKSTPQNSRVVVLLFVLLTLGEVDFESPEWFSLFPANIRIAKNPTLILESTKIRLPSGFLNSFFHPFLYQVCGRYSWCGLLAEVTTFPILSLFFTYFRIASNKAFGSTDCMQKNLPASICPPQPCSQLPSFLQPLHLQFSNPTTEFLLWGPHYPAPSPSLEE